MKNITLDRKNLIFAVLAVLLMLTFVYGGRSSLDKRDAFVPEDTVSTMDNERSQVYVSGKDYKLDIQTQQKHKDQQQKRSRILEEEEASRQQSESQKRVSDTQGEPRRDQQGRPVKVPPKKPEQKPTEPEDPGDPGDDQPEDDVPTKENRLPTITIDLMGGQSVTPRWSFKVNVIDYKNQNIPVFSNGDGHFEVYVNGSKVTSAGVNGKWTRFDVEFKEGKNTIKVVATDKRKKQATQTVTVRCKADKTPKIIGSVTVSASAPSLKIGTIFSGIKVDIVENEPLREILSDAFKKAGVSAEMSSSYLAALKKSGIAKEAKITDELREKAEEKRVTLIEREDWPSGWQNRLREKDFCSHSGWVYYVNGSMPGVGIGSFVPDDGDEIQLVFRLFEGDD